MRRIKLLLVMSAFGLGAAATLGFATMRGGVAGSHAASAATPQPDARAAERRTEHLHPARLWPSLRGALRAMGDRLERPGKERLTLSGTLTLDGESAPFSLVTEFPGRLRLEFGARGGARVLVFDERAAAHAAAEGRDADLLETLAFDSAEHFLSGLSRGLAARVVGTRFRADSAETPDYAGPFYDIYQVSESVGVGRAARRRSKLYYVNSDTQLLERVQYEDARGGVRTRVRVEFEWQQVEGQRVLKRLTREEDGSPVLTLVVDSAAVGRGAEDGLFAPAERPRQ
jgi:hypothetical protein